MTALAAARVVTPQGVLAPGVVEVAGGLVESVGPAGGRVPDRTITAGFVDLQVNGHDDVDVALADGDDWERLDRHLCSQGVTAWCPTLTTAPLDAYPAALERVATAAARDAGPRPAILGVHLEGPFLGGRPGVHPAELLRPLDHAWLAELPDLVRVVTLAPELDGACDAIEGLARRGTVVALGHSTASFEQAERAAEAGATLVTHVFNGMSPLHHRAPGLVGAALTDDRLAVSLVADLVHVHPALLRLVLRAKGPGAVALVTDAVAWRGPGATERGVRLVDGAPRTPDGTLAGSDLTMDRAVRNLVHRAGVAPEAALAAASSTPCALLGDPTRGLVEVGRRADLVALGPDLAVERTWIGGEQVYP